MQQHGHDLARGLLALRAAVARALEQLEPPLAPGLVAGLSPAPAGPTSYDGRRAPRAAPPVLRSARSARCRKGSASPGEEEDPTPARGSRTAGR